MRPDEGYGESVLRLETTYDDGRLVLRVVGELDLASAPAFRQALTSTFAELAGEPVQAVVVDLGACDHLDSVGVGLLLSVLKRTRTAGASLALVSAEPRLRRVLDLTGVDRLVPVLDRVETTEPVPGSD
jgi:anti-sigma B factor antagonist